MELFRVVKFQFEILSSSVIGRVVIACGNQTERKSLLVLGSGFGLHFGRCERCDFVVVRIIIVVVVVVVRMLA